MQDVLHRRLAWMTEPQILFPLLTVLLLLAIWGTTLGVFRVERVAAEHRAADASRELVDTYEAQVVRALREKDQTLQLVRFRPHRRSGFPPLTRLKNLGLLPPDFPLPANEFAQLLRDQTTAADYLGECRAVTPA